MDTRTIGYFFELCKTGSFTAAADALFVSRQAVAYDIKRLETELGVALFRRSKKGVELTEAGVLFKEGVEHMRAEFDTVLAQMRATASNHSEVIRFGCNYTYFDELTSRTILEFEQDNPGVEIRVIHVPDLPQCWEQLRTDEIDLAMTPNLASDVALPFYSNGNQTVHLCVSTQNPLAQRTSVRIPEDLAGLTVGVATEFERQFFAQIGHTGPIQLIPTMSIMRSMVESDRLVLIAADRQSKDYSHAPCVRIPVENCALSTLFVMQDKPSPATERLAQLLSGSTLRRDPDNHPLPYRDDPNWPFVP